MITTLPISTRPLTGEPTGTPTRTAKLFGKRADGTPEFYDLGSVTNTYDITHYGAIGNGSDSGAAIAAAYAAMPDGGTLIFPPGFYVTSAPLIVAKSLTIIAHGATLKGASPSVATLISVIASGFSVYGLTFDGAFTTGTTAPSNWVGLLDIIGSTGTTVDAPTIERCKFQNSAACGIRIQGNVDGARVEGNQFFNNFIHLFAQPDGVRTYKNLSAKNNRYLSTWYTGQYSGCIKLKGDGAHSLYPTGIQISNEKIVSGAEMGIELWDNIKDSSVECCHVDGTTFGISLDANENTTVALNKTWRNSYCGIELADACHDCTVKLNTVDQYSAGTTRGGSKGIVSSGPDCFRNIIDGNTVRGVSGPAIDLQGNNHISVRNNRFYDSVILINFKNCDYMVARENDLYGPTNYHVFLDFNDKNCTDIAIVDNTFCGAGLFDNIIIYSGPSGRVASNITITGNDGYSSTFVNKSINVNATVTATNLQTFDNRFLPGSSTSNFDDYAATPSSVIPFRSHIQGGSIPTAAKRTLNLIANASAQWVRLVNFQYGNPLQLMLHVFARTTDYAAQNALTAQISAAPYGFGSAVTLYPSGNYFGGIIDEIIYNNPQAVSGGSQQEVWVKFKPLSIDVIAIFYFSDYAWGVVATPTATTTQPTWDPNTYHAQIEAGNSQALQVPALWSRSSITSSSKGAIADSDRGGRLHIRGAGDTSYNSTQRVARFDIADGTDSAGVDLNGVLYANKKFSAGGGWAINKILAANGSPDFGTINAGSEFSYNLYVGGVATNSISPTILLGWASGFPLGIVVKQVYVSSTNFVTVVLRNTTTSNIAVGVIGVTATVLIY